MTTPSQPIPFGSRLRSLPGFTPPPNGWRALEQRLDGRSRHRRSLATGLALAASLIVTLAVTLLPEPTHQGGDRTVSEQRNVQIAQLMERSRNLESSLATLRPSVALWDGRSAEQAALLERGLSIVDFQLAYAHPDNRHRLWQDRVELLSNLVRTHREAGLIEVAEPISSESQL